MNILATVNAEHTQSAYVLDAPYTWSYFEFQNPLLMSFIARLNGYQMPSIDEPFTYCDLGCGNGVSVNLLASTFPQGHFYGIDFNAEHIANAQAIADKAGLKNVTFIDASFEQYEKSDPPKFDFIAMHGIYSWVGLEVREQIQRLVDTTLKPGGLVYVCYNTLPGWSDLIPLWKMMQAYTAHLPVDSLTKARVGLKNLSFLRDQGASYFRDNPAASRYLDRLLKRDPHYVAHEFCNGCFEPQYFMDVAADFGQFGIDYAGTMKIHRNNMSNILSSRYHDHLKSTPDPLERESRASFIRNEFFRRDLYIRDGVKLADDKRGQLLDDIIPGATVTEAKFDSKIDLGKRQIDLQKQHLRLLQKLMASGEHSIGELVRHPKLTGLGADKIRNDVVDIMGGYQIQPLAKKVKASEFNLRLQFEMPSQVNRSLIEERLIDEGKTYLESDTLGSALRLNFINGLLVAALHQRTFKAAVAHVKSQVAEFDKSKRKQLGMSSEDQVSNWVDLKAERFVKNHLPVLVRFGIVRNA